MDARSYADTGSYFPSSVMGTSKPKEQFYFDTYDPIPSMSAKAIPSVRPKRAALVSEAPVSSKAIQQSVANSMAPAVSSLGFGLGLGRYGNEIPSPIDAEIQQTVLEMQQELAYVEASTNVDHMRHSIRLLKERCSKLENTVDPDWVEVDINKPIRVTKRILIPNFRHPTINYVGRIMGSKGSTLQNIAKKYKAHISVMGAGSTKDAIKEAELLSTGDPRHAHFASPLHVRIDIIAAPHIAHTRLAGLMNLFSKLLAPVKDVVIEGINDGTVINKENGEQDDQLINEVELFMGETHARVPTIKRSSNSNLQCTVPAKMARGAISAVRGTRGAGRGGRGGFVPRERSNS